MTIAFVFPGQGSQSIGMLTDLIDLPVVKETIEQASEALGQDLLGLMQQGPEQELNLTVNTQPVMLTASVAFYRAWQAIGGTSPTMMAGHSLGEYSALTAAGVLDLADAVRLVRIRAQAMQEAVPVGVGTMAAILGLDDRVVVEVCQKTQAQHTDWIVQAVNFNALGQVVIAGHTAAVEQACERAKEAGAKRAVVLPVSAPFHSSLLEPAAQRLQEALNNIELGVPKLPVINNVDVAIHTDPAQIKDALVRQVWHPVRWVETVQYMANNEVTDIVECGPGKVLAGLAKRIDPRVKGHALVDQASLTNLKTSLAALM